MSIGDLQFKVRQYEDLIGTIGQSSGYGNVLLLDCLRRLSLTMMLEYAVGHPSENEALAAMRKGRTRLLDSPAVAAMLVEELNMSPPGGSWHLSENRQQIDFVFQSKASDFGAQSSRLLFGLSKTADLMRSRDVYGVLLRLIEVDAVECAHLPGFLQFRTLGGRMEDALKVARYDPPMESAMLKFRFAPLGINGFDENLSFYRGTGFRSAREETQRIHQACPGVGGGGEARNCY